MGRQPGYGVEDGKVEDTVQQSPEKPAVVDISSGHDSADQTGNSVDKEDGQVDLRLLQLQAAEREREYQQQDAGEQIGNKK